MPRAFAPLPPVPDHPSLEARRARALGGRADVRAAPRAEPRRSALQLRRRADHGQQPDGRSPRVGPDAEGRLPALQGAPRLRPALPERIRLPGPLGGGGGGEGAGAQLEARDRGVRPRGVCRALQGARRATYARGHHRAVEAPRHVDGLGRRLLHVLRHEHRVHLALPQGRARAGLALPGASRDAVVPALRHVDLPARGLFGRVPRARAPVALRPLPAARPRGRVARRLDDDPLDVARQRRGGRAARGRVRPDGGRRVVRRRSQAGRGVRGTGARRGSRRSPVSRALRRPGGGGRGRAPRDPVGARSRSRKGRASSTSPPGPAPRTSSSGGSTSSPCSSRSTSRASSTTRTARWPGSRRAKPRRRSSPACANAACSSTRGRSSTAIRRAGAARRRCSSASSTTGSSPPRRSGSRCSTRTRPSSGRRPSTRSGWTTGCGTWATGTSRASAISGSRSRSIRAPAAT